MHLPDSRLHVVKDVIVWCPPHFTLAIVWIFLFFNPPLHPENRHDGVLDREASWGLHDQKGRSATCRLHITSTARSESYNILVSYQ